MKHLKKISFSKVLMAILLLINAIVIGFTIFMVYRLSDTSPLLYLIPSVAAELSAATAFYYWKAKAENKAKYAQRYIAELAQAYGIEHVERICEIIFTH